MMTYIVGTSALSLILLAAAPAAATGQQDTAKLDTVHVTVTRGSGRSILASPFALTVTRPDSTRPGQRHSAADEMLALIPGLSAANRNNPSQDARLSIRGFGARSAFGVRGVRVLRDGMPLTLPDGQTPLDYMSLESIGHIEVIRGAASALYGNASGGVIDVRTTEPAASAHSLDARQWLGGDAYSRSVVAASGAASRTSYVADAAHIRSDGARVNARQRSTTGFARIAHSAELADYALTVMALDNPVSQNPGALTLAEMRADPRLADPSSVRRRARKAVKQIQIGVSAHGDFGSGQLSLSAFGGSRSLDNPLTFAVVEIGRHSQGASAAFTTAGVLGRVQHRLVAGLDFQSQNDLRRNYFACADTVAPAVPTASCPDASSDRGIVTLDQREIVSSIGAYVSDDVTLSSKVIASAGIRADNIRFEVRDRLMSTTNPDDSGQRSLGSISPIAGIVAMIAPTSSLYANVSSAFETPTATELGNQPDGSAGINSELAAQKSVTFEIGARGFAGAGIRYDVATFSTGVRDELVPFEIPGSDGRRYFRNAGRTRRRGAEAGFEISKGGATAAVSYNYSRFSFRKFEAGGSDFSGNEIPGLPRHRGQGALSFSRGGGFAVMEGEVSGSGFTDDANTFRAPGYGVLHLRGGFRPRTGRANLSVTAGVQNVFDRSYAASVAVNAARERYFEPAVPRTFFAGLALGLQDSSERATRK